jgi:predicted RNase H-like HicB family nuclease
MKGGVDMGVYVYPVILTPEKDGYFVDFPDVESCYTQGDSLADALEMAKDVLALRLCAYENDKKTIPPPSLKQDFELEENQIVSLVSADTMEYRKIWDSKAVKKTLTIPAWLNTLAEKNDVNFSAVLQKALKDELKIAEREGDIMKREVIFEVVESLDGGYEAKAIGYSIFTQFDDYSELEETLRDAVACHFDENLRPKIIRVHFLKEEVFAV